MKKYMYELEVANNHILKDAIYKEKIETSILYLSHSLAFAVYLPRIFWPQFIHWLSQSSSVSLCVSSLDKIT